MMTDPIADVLTRIRNAGKARHAETTCPASKLKGALAKVLAEEGFIVGVREATEDGHPVLVLSLRYREDGSMMIDGLKRISTPGRRVYVGADEVPKVRAGIGISVLSTSKGVMCDRAAREAHVGGEVLCEVW
jgi:small subunit ribosomal protein S8